MSRFKDLISRGLIVSCQLDSGEPMHTPQHCALFAQAAEMGGAVAVRIEGLQNAQEVRATVRLPVIGCVRGQYEDGWMLVTPDLASVDQLVRLGVEVVALDATLRIRPDGSDGSAFIARIRKRHPKLMLLADISTFDEGIRAADAGADALSTALYGRTRNTMDMGIDSTPQLDLIYRLATTISVPVFAEGFIWSTHDAAEALEAGAYGAIVGGAITRPRVITQLYVNAVESGLLNE